MSCKTYNISLDSVVKAAAIDLGEDPSKVTATFRHWAVRGLEILSNQTLNLGKRRELIKLNKQTKTIPIPIDSKRVTYVGFINECGEKEHLRQNVNIVGNIEPNELSKCEKCGECIDICEKLEVTVKKNKVDINGTLYDETVTKKLLGDTYYQITNTPYYDAALDDVVYREHKEYLTNIELNDCGCPKSTDENINSIKEHCYTCYCQCYNTCDHQELDRGTYNILSDRGEIQIGSLDSDITHIYIEYVANLPKENGEFVIPHLTYEPLIAYIKWKYYEHRKSISLQERVMMRNQYIIEKNNMKKIMGKLSLSEIVKILRGLPVIDVNMNTTQKGVGGSKHYSYGLSSSSNITIVENNGNIVEDNW